jgi:hypothetical protein
VRRDRARDVVDRRAGALAVDDVDAMAALARDGGQHERPDARHLLLALAHAIHPPVPADVRRLDEHDRPRGHFGGPYI